MIKNLIVSHAPCENFPCRKRQDVCKQDGFFSFNININILDYSKVKHRQRRQEQHAEKTPDQKQPGNSPLTVLRKKSTALEVELKVKNLRTASDNSEEVLVVLCDETSRPGGETKPIRRAWTGSRRVFPALTEETWSYSRGQQAEGEITGCSCSFGPRTARPHCLHFSPLEGGTDKKKIREMIFSEKTVNTDERLWKCAEKAKTGLLKLKETTQAKS